MVLDTAAVLRRPLSRTATHKRLTNAMELVALQAEAEKTGWTSDEAVVAAAVPKTTAADHTGTPPRATVTFAAQPLTARYRGHCCSVARGKGMQAR